MTTITTLCGASPPKRDPFLCECGDSFCPVVIVMTPAEYVRLRGRDEFVYAPGHEGGVPSAVSPSAPSLTPAAAFRRSGTSIGLV